MDELSGLVVVVCVKSIGFFFSVEFLCGCVKIFSHKFVEFVRGVEVLEVGFCWFDLHGE